MHDGIVCDLLLVTVGHVEVVNPAQMHEGRVLDGRLVAVVRIERLDPVQVYEGCIRDLVAHDELFNPAQVQKVESVMVAWLQSDSLSE